MTVYAVAQISISDRPTYDRYASGFMPILQQYGGQILAADESPEVLEGTFNRQKVVILAFPDREACLKWATSAEYQEISKDRVKATTGEILLVKGL